MARRPTPSRGRLVWPVALLGSGLLGLGSFVLVKGELVSDVLMDSSSSSARSGASSAEMSRPVFRSRAPRDHIEREAPTGSGVSGAEDPAPADELLTGDQRAALHRARTQALIRMVDRHQRRWRDVPWHRKQDCREATSDKAPASFVRFAPSGFEVFADPAVPVEATARVTKELPRSRELVSSSLGIDAEPPAVYVYKDLDSLRKNSCANGSAVAYYDGSIHLSLFAADPGYRELTRSLQHEYVHHALIGHGIQEPAWFQEGLAMVLSGEPLGRWRPRGRLLDITEMVAPLPAQADADRTQAHYGQAYAMTAFVQKLCANRERCGYSNLVDGLDYENAAPATLFEWIVDERASMLSKSPKALWESYAANDMQLLPLDAAALAELAASEPNP